MRRMHLGRAATALGLAAVLASCAQPTQPTTPVTPPPADAPTALAHGMAGGPLFEALRSKVRMTIGDGSQKATDFDMVVFDGDGFSPEQIGQDELIRDAIHGNVWVLGLDVKEAHKDVGLGDLLHSSSGGDADAYLVRQAKDETGRLGSRLIEFANPDQEAEYRAQEIVRYVKEELIPQQEPVPNTPARALTYLIDHTNNYQDQVTTNNPVFNGKIWPPAVPDSANNPQTLNWTVDHQISLFLNASDNSFGDFQHVLVDQVGLADPGPLAINNQNRCTPNGYQCEVAFFQTRFDASTSVPEGSGLILIEATPKNTNGVTTVTSGGYSFGVGYSEDSGPGASFTYTSPTETTTISEWLVKDDSGEAAQWSFASNSVYSGTNYQGDGTVVPYDSNNWYFFGGGVAPNVPNSLSLNTFNYTTESYWKSNEVIQGDVVFSGEDRAWFNDVYVVQYQYDDNPQGFNHWCLYGCQFDNPGPDQDPLQLVQHFAVHNPSNPWSLTVDMSAVIPVPTKSLTFSQNPVTAGETVQATLTLAGPTKVPATVLVSSGTSGITPENDTYTIPANSDTLTFNILTGGEGCDPQSATIQAFYADGQNASLTVNPPPNCQ